MKSNSRQIMSAGSVRASSHSNIYWNKLLFFILFCRFGRSFSSHDSWMISIRTCVSQHNDSHTNIRTSFVFNLVIAMFYFRFVFFRRRSTKTVLQSAGSLSQTRFVDQKTSIENFWFWEHEISFKKIVYFSVQKWILSSVRSTLKQHKG